MRSPSTEISSPIQGRFKAAICDALEEKNLSQRSFARELGLSPSTLNMKINGKRHFTLEEAVQLAELLDLSLDGLKEK